jgi:Holliday junction resolvase RusA-like endonuclease
MGRCKVSGRIDMAVLHDYVITNATPEIYLMFVDNGLFSFEYSGAVKAKERPRSGKGGRMYTPTETRKFEKAVADWGKDVWDGPPLRYPIRVRLMVNEFTDDQRLVSLSRLGLVYNQKGDVDNLGKSILDGLNGVMYKDDKQIVDLQIRRQYSDEAGFKLEIARAGLTPLEYSNFIKRLK